MASSGTPRHSKKASVKTVIDLEPADITLMPDEPAPNAAEAEEIQPEPQISETFADIEHPAPFDQAPPIAGAPPSAAPARGGSALAGGVIGAVMALAGGAGLQWVGVLPSFQNSSDIAALRQQVSAIAERPDAPAADAAVVEGLRTAQTGLQKNAEAFAAELTALTGSQRKMSEEFAALKASAGTGSGDPGASAALSEKLAALEAQIAKASSADSAPQLAQIEQKLAALENAAQNAGGATGVAQAIAAADLKAAIDRGGDFAGELETYATVTPGSPELEPLKTLAASGVPSMAELTSAFPSAASAMISATEAADPDAGLLQRLASSAKSLVRSRQIGPIPGDSTEALVARMEVAVNRGDLNAALGEAGKLPDAARAAGIDYINKLTARRDTDALVTKALTSALTAAGAAR